MNKNSTLSPPPSCTVIIVAAGNGSRFGNSIPKQYHKIYGKTVLRHTIDGFLSNPLITHIQVVISKDFQDFYEDSVAGLSRLHPVVYGGTTRQESVFNALSSLSLNEHDIVLIHDAARPCFSQKSLTALIDCLQDHQAASLGLPIADTLRKTENGVFKNIIDRNQIYAMQTPQGFHFGMIQKAHERFKGQNFTDDTGLVSEMGIAVKIVQGSPFNIKITMPEDMIMAERNLAPRPRVPRTGIGFDVHAFGDSSPSIRIGGIDIPHTHKLKGHSDADVLLHAITDALYGAIADGDIGSHFPPSNPAYKGKDSSFFLEEAVKAVKSKDGKIIHIDSVIMCEAPKIGPHRELIQHRIAYMIGLSPSRVSIKATTTEELGFTGRREGIAAQAIVTVMLPDGDENEF